MPELPSSAPDSKPDTRTLTALDVPLGKGVVVIICEDSALMVLQVIIAAVVGMAAPGGRGQEMGHAGDMAAWVPGRLR